MARTNGTDVVLMIYNMLCNLDSYIGKVLAVHVFIFGLPFILLVFRLTFIYVTVLDVKYNRVYSVIKICNLSNNLFILHFYTYKRCAAFFSNAER